MDKIYKKKKIIKKERKKDSGLGLWALAFSHFESRKPHAHAHAKITHSYNHYKNHLTLKS